MNQIEIWQSLSDDRDYEISNLGRVKSYKKGKIKILKGHVDKLGYLRIFINNKSMLVHRAVIKTFIGESSLEVNHKNGIKLDNSIENLEYVTRKENMKHAFDNNLVDVPRLKGENHGRSKLTQSQINEIRSLLKEQKMSKKQIANIFDVHRHTIYRIEHKLNWKEFLCEDSI